MSCTSYMKCSPILGPPFPHPHRFCKNAEHFISLNCVLCKHPPPSPTMDARILSPKLTSEKLGLLDMTVTEMDPDVLSQSGASQRRIRALSPTGSVRTAMSSRLSHRRSTRRSSKFIHGHRSSMSKELTAKAEKKFFALMELMATASSTATSLKEVWMEIISEREAWSSREEELLEQIDEYCDKMERIEKDQHQHHHEHDTNKKTIDSLKIEITSLTATVSEYKKKCNERDHELEHCRRELHEYKETATRVREQYEETKRSYEEIELKYRACEEERDSAKADAERHHGELRTLTREYAELKSSYTEITEKYDSTFKDLTVIREKVFTCA